MWWSLIAGGAKYLAAARLDDATRRNHARTCSTCPHLMVFAEDELPAAARAAFAVYGVFAEAAYRPYTGWCGEPGQPGDEGTCGCLVAAEAPHGARVDITIKGRQMRGAGRADSDGYSCPLKKW